MEFERTQIKKNFFGNYRAAEVDSLLDAAEQLLQQKEAAIAEASEKVKAELEEAERLSAELKGLKEEAEHLREANDFMSEQNQKLSEECKTHEETERSLRDELDGFHIKMGEIRTELELANSQAAVLSNRVARQRRELEEKDKLLMADPVGEANKRAEQIIRNATNLSKQMLDDAEKMRSRALAAVRAAYFNTMGFRKNLEENFSNLQTDLDQSMRTLRTIEAENDSGDQEIVQEKW